MSAADFSDPFTGTWILLPEQNRYSYGPPPRAGRYTISAAKAGHHFDVAWLDWRGQHQSVQFTLPLGGDGPIRLIQITPRVLDSEIWRADQLINHARRTLSADGQHLHISQAGVRPDGRAFVNLQEYRRTFVDDPLVAAPLRVAVIGPYSAPDASGRAASRATLESAAAEVLRRGHIPLLGVSASADIVSLAGLSEPNPAIMAISMAVIASADIALVLGSSPGADRERAHLLDLGRPEITRVEDLPA